VAEIILRRDGFTFGCDGTGRAGIEGVIEIGIWVVEGGGLEGWGDAGRVFNFSGFASGLHNVDCGGCGYRPYAGLLTRIAVSRERGGRSSYCVLALVRISSTTADLASA
jgi:hypothetical protein